jgi:hypothetical protein
MADAHGGLEEKSGHEQQEAHPLRRVGFFVVNEECSAMRDCGARRWVQSRNPTNSWLREGCWSLRTAFASIWRMRSRVTLKICPTSSSV